MPAKFLKVVALSRKPVPAPVEEVPPTKGTVPSQVTVSREVREGPVTRDTASSEGTVSPIKGSAPQAHLRGTVPSQDTVPFKLYRCSTAQDGHSFAEERLYNALWHARQTRIESNDTRVVTVGWDLMSKLAGMTPRNVKENCLRLIGKLALEKVEGHRSEERIGTTYRLYSYSSILDRRRRAGLEWITRNRGGVAFVSAPPDGPLLASSGATVSPEPPPTRDTVPSQATVSVSSEDRGTVSSEDTPLDRNSVSTRQTSSSQSLSGIPTTAAQLGVSFDDDAVRKLVRRCQDADPKASDDEIAYFLEAKIRQLQRSKTVTNFVGLLIASVPVFFSPPATELARYRQAKAAGAREAAERQERLASEARKILDDPHATESEKTMARGWLPDAPAGEGKSP